MQVRPWSLYIMGPTRQPRLVETLEMELPYVTADGTPFAPVAAAEDFPLRGWTLRGHLSERGYELTHLWDRPIYLSDGAHHVNVADLQMRRSGGRNTRRYRLMPPIRPVSDLRLLPNAEKHGADENWILFFMEEVTEQYGVLFQGFDLFPVTLAELREHAPEQLVAWDAFLERGGVAHPHFYRGTNPLAPTED